MGDSFPHWVRKAAATFNTPMDLTVGAAGSWFDQCIRAPAAGDWRDVGRVTRHMTFDVLTPAHLCSLVGYIETARPDVSRTPGT